MSRPLYTPGLWLPNNRVILHQHGAKGKIHMMKCSGTGFQRLRRRFESNGQQPMTLLQIHKLLNKPKRLRIN